MSLLDEGVTEVIESAMAERVFPGAVVWLARGDDLLLQAAYGTTAYGDVGSVAVKPATIYDIASLTKLFTATAALRALRQSGHMVEAPVARFLPDFAGPLGEITVRHLLNHTSGIEVAIQAMTEIDPAEWVREIVAHGVGTRPGAAVRYSCTNYFLLGRIVERLTSQSLDEFIKSGILEPLGMEHTTCSPLEKFPLTRIAPTEVDSVTGKAWQGVVHDEAARAWQAATGTLCGNAGLFAPASDVGRFARFWVGVGAIDSRDILHPEDMQHAFCQLVPEESYWRGWCWQIDAAFYMSELAPPGTAGHTGFTGPTLLLNPRTQHIAIILNNRVYPTRNGPNRMPYHRRIAELFFQHNF